MRWTRFLLICFVALVACAPAALFSTHPTAVSETVHPPSSTIATSTAPLSIPTTASQTAQIQPTYADPHTTPEPTEIIGALEQSSKRRLNVERIQWSLSNNPLWLVSTNSNQVLGHFVAIYTHTQDGWRELARATLGFEIINSVKVVQIESRHVWVEVSSFTGIGASNYTLFAFDGTTFIKMIDHNYQNPGGGWLQDIDQDHIPEVVLSNTSCALSYPHRCYIQLPGFTVQRWNEVHFVNVPLTLLANTAPAELRRFTNQAVALAQGGRWKEAQTTISQTFALQSISSHYDVDAELIHLHAVARADMRYSRTGGDYPLERFAYNLAYGDYDAVLQQMRVVPDTVLFSEQSPMLLHTTDNPKDFESLRGGQIAEWLLTTTSQAIKNDTNFAPAYFLRGWTTYFACPRDSQMLADLARAAQLAPNEQLFANSLMYAKRTYATQPEHCSSIR